MSSHWETEDPTSKITNWIIAIAITLIVAGCLIFLFFDRPEKVRIGEAYQGYQACDDHEAKIHAEKVWKVLIRRIRP